MNSTICYKCKYKCNCCKHNNSNDEFPYCANCNVEHPRFDLDTEFIKQCPQKLNNTIQEEKK